MPRANFTRHAFERVDERLHLTHKEVAEILDSGKTALVRQETNPVVGHFLFYSKVDSTCFIAIQSEKDGSVITILPPNCLLRYKISEHVINDLVKAGNSHAATGSTTPTGLKLDSPGRYIELSFRRYDTNKVREHVYRFKSRPPVCTPGELYKVFDDESFRVAIRDEIMEVMSEDREMLVSVHAKLGRHGKKEPIDVAKFG